MNLREAVNRNEAVRIINSYGTKSDIVAESIKEAIDEKFPGIRDKFPQDPGGAKSADVPDRNKSGIKKNGLWLGMNKLNK